MKSKNEISFKLQELQNILVMEDKVDVVLINAQIEILNWVITPGKRGRKLGYRKPKNEAQEVVNENGA